MKTNYNPVMTLTVHEKTNLARFARFIHADDALKSTCELWAALPAGSSVPLADFDRLMAQYRAWLVFGTLPVASAA